MMILTCFIHTLCHIYAFSGTNLLTRCRRASCCFLLFLVSEILQRKYSRNWTKSTPRSYFSTKLPEDRGGYEVGRRGAATLGPRGLGWARAALACGAPVSPPTLPFRLLKVFVANTPVLRATIRKTFQRRRRRQSHLGGFRRSPPAPCQREESSPGGLFIAMIASGLMCE